jgi:hypothetical protein
VLRNIRWFGFVRKRNMDLHLAKRLTSNPFAQLAFDAWVVGFKWWSMSLWLVLNSNKIEHKPIADLEFSIGGQGYSGRSWEFLFQLNKMPIFPFNV